MRSAWMSLRTTVFAVCSVAADGAGASERCGVEWPEASVGILCGFVDDATGCCVDDGGGSAIQDDMAAIVAVIGVEDQGTVQVRVIEYVHCGGDDSCWEAASRDRLDAGAVRHLDIEAAASGVDIGEGVYIGSAEEKCRMRRCRL